MNAHNKMFQLESELKIQLLHEKEIDAHLFLKRYNEIIDSYNSQWLEVRKK